MPSTAMGVGVGLGPRAFCPGWVGGEGTMLGRGLLSQPGSTPLGSSRGGTRLPRLSGAPQGDVCELPTGGLGKRGGHALSLAEHACPTPRGTPAHQACVRRGEKLCTQQVWGKHQLAERTVMSSDAPAGHPGRAGLWQRGRRGKVMSPLFSVLSLPCRACGVRLDSASAPAPCLHPAVWVGDAPQHCWVW